MISRRILVAVALLCLVSPAHAQKTKSALTSEINANWPDNTNGQITPALLRSTVIDIVNSYYDLAGGTSLSCAAHQWIAALPTLSSITCSQPTAADLSGLGTGVATALGVNVGTAGAFVVNGGALGTPSSGTLSSATGLPISTGVSGLGTGIATALGVNTGSAGAPVLFNGALGTPSSGTLTSATGLPISTGVSGLGTGIATALGVNTGSAGAPVLFNGALGTPSSGTLTSVTGLPISTGVSGLGSGVGTALGVATNGAGGFPIYTASTWTPVLTTSGTVGTPVYSSQVGSYEQIGRQVTARFTISLSSWGGSPTGNISLTGLPVAAANVANDNGICRVGAYVVTGLAASNIGMGGIVTPNTSIVSLFQFSNTTDSAITAAQFGATGFVAGMCTYHT